MNNTILKMSNISKQFSGVTVLDHVNFSLEKGEVHVLCGENGAGKSTLMKILTGVYQRDDGEIFLQDETGELKPTEFASPKAALDTGISMVFQEFNLMDNMSIAENIYIGYEPTKHGLVDHKTICKQADEQLKRLSLNIPSTRVVNTLTTAEKQCVEIAKCLSHKAKIIILDEPTSSLSEKEVVTLFELIRLLKSQGISIIYISHRMEEIFEIGDRITVFRDGQLIDTVNVNETDTNELVKMIIGREFKESTSEFNSEQDKTVLLECRDISVGNFDAKFDFKAYAGEIVGVFGLVGAGRTELARTIFGLDPIRDGKIFKNGQAIKVTSPSSAIKHGIGLVPEDRKTQGLILTHNIRDNLTLSKLRDLPWVLISRIKEIQITDKYMNLLSIACHSQKQMVERLSGGNQQKVVIAKWLSLDLDVLIMDEPTRGVDVGAKAEIYEIMRDLAKAGKCIIMISSDLPEILRVSHRVKVMHDGNITLDAPITGLNQEIIMHAAIS